MPETPVLKYLINDPVELNLSYMPFLVDGGIFVPTNESFSLGTKISVELSLPGRNDSLKIEGRIAWITPANALYQVIPGVGVQFIGSEASNIRAQIEAGLDKSMEIGGYTLGTPRENKETKSS